MIDYREEYERRTGEKISRWDGVFNPDYVEYLESQLKKKDEVIKSGQDGINVVDNIVNDFIIKYKEAIK